MFAELLLLAVVLVGFLLALPRIMRLPGLPRELALEEVPDSALTPAQSAHLARLDALFERIQYRPVFNLRVTNLANANLSRFYTSSADPALLLTSLLRVETKGGTAQNEDYVEMITRYRDGTELATLNSPVTSVFADPPQRITQRFPRLDPIRLKERHDQAAAELLEREPVWHDPADILQRWRESHRRWCEHQESQGLLRYEAAGDRYRLSASTGLRGVANFINPIAREMTLGRLLGAALFATVLPTAAILGLRTTPDVAAPLGAVLGVSASAVANVVIAVAILAGGVAIGLVFGRKHFAGTFALGLLPAVILGRASFGAPFLALIAMEWVAVLTHTWNNQRRRLL